MNIQLNYQESLTLNIQLNCQESQTFHMDEHSVKLSGKPNFPYR